MAVYVLLGRRTESFGHCALNRTADRWHSHAMNLSQDDVVAILSKLKGEHVYLRTRVTARDDPSLGALRFETGAIVKECDDDGLHLTWPPDEEFYLRLDGSIVQTSRSQ